jgi:hypothetical protein
MGSSRSPGRLAPDFDRLVSWFGPPAAIGLAAMALVIVDSRFRLEGAVFGGLAAAWPATLAASLFAQGRGFGRRSAFLLQIVAGVVAAALVLFSGKAAVSLDYFYAGLAAACFAAPAARLKDPDAYWVWAERFCVAGAFAFAVALVGWGASMATVFSANHLFGLFSQTVGARLTADLAAIFYLGLGPLAFLALQPPLSDERLATDATDFIRRAVAALASWALAPFVLVYSALLWLYAGKIIVERALPDGQIGWMVAAFGLSALATIFLVAPQRRDGPPQTRLLWRIWPFLAIAPLGLLAFAIHARVSAYGLTPDRYMLALMGAVCAANAFVALVSREAVLRFAPAAGAAALILGGLGPWGAIGTSVRWQSAALRDIYAAQGRLADGRLVMAGGVPALTPQDARRCRAAVEFLASTEINGLADLLAESDRRLAGQANNFCPPPEPPRDAHLGFYVNEQSVPNDAVRGYAILGFFQLNRRSKIEAGGVVLVGNEGIVTVSQGGGEAAIFDMGEIVRRHDPRSQALLQGPLLAPTSGDPRFAFLVQSLSLSRSDGEVKLDGLSGFLLRRD